MCFYFLLTPSSIICYDSSWTMDAPYIELVCIWIPNLHKAQFINKPDTITCVAHTHTINVLDTESLHESFQNLCSCEPTLIPAPHTSHAMNVVASLSYYSSWVFMPRLAFSTCCVVLRTTGEHTASQSVKGLKDIDHHNSREKWEWGCSWCMTGEPTCCVESVNAGEVDWVH